MPIYRGPDGKIVEDKTIILKPKPQATDATLPVVELPPVPQFDDHESPEIDIKTSIVGGRRNRQPASLNIVERDMNDPIVGWLVITQGPGQGAVLSLGYGSNSIGRSSTQRIQLNFGDDEISRAEHALITYDPRGRKYYLQGGAGANLVYLGADETVVLSPTELPANSLILLGETTLRFVPFCSSDFDWQDIKK